MVTPAAGFAPLAGAGGNRLPGMNFYSSADHAQEVPDTPATRGMIAKIQHLVRVVGKD